MQTIDRTSTAISRPILTKSDEDFLMTVVWPVIKKTTIRKNSNRKNSGTGRSQVFGWGDRRGLGFGPFANNKKFPMLWRVLAEFGAMAVPHEISFTAIQVNFNYQTTEHIDKNNIGLSYSISFGDFDGGELVVEGVPFQTRLAPLIFNGALMKHYNNPIIGNRYSLVFFVSAPKKFTDEQVFDFHNQILKDIETKEEIKVPQLDA